jgi:hypothetical protein
MDQQPIQIGQFILGKNLGIGAFGKVCQGERGLKINNILDVVTELIGTSAGCVLRIFVFSTCF